MTKSAESRFVYVTYIRTTPERVWSALTNPEFAQQYWRAVRPDAEWKMRGARPEADWKVGGAWKLDFARRYGLLTPARSSSSSRRRAWRSAGATSSGRS